MISLQGPSAYDITFVIAKEYQGEFDYAVAWLETKYEETAKVMAQAVHQLEGKVALYKVVDRTGDLMRLERIFVPIDGE